MSEVDDLVSAAQKQLDEHKKWLVMEIESMAAFGTVDPLPDWQRLRAQAREVKLRVARVHGDVATVVYEYPDELVAFLRSDAAPAHLRAALAGGHVVDPDKPAFTARRSTDVAVGPETKAENEPVIGEILARRGS